VIEIQSIIEKPYIGSLFTCHIVNIYI